MKIPIIIEILSYSIIEENVSLNFVMTYHLLYILPTEKHKINFISGFFFLFCGDGAQT